MDDIKQNNHITALSIFIVFIVYAYSVYSNFVTIFSLKIPSWGLRFFGAFVLGGSFIVFFFTLLNNRFVVKKTVVLIVLFIVLVLISYYISDLRYGENETAKDTLEDFFARAIPAIFVGIVAVEKTNLKLLSKATDLLLLLFTVCSSKMLWLSIFLGYSTVSWDSVFNYNYQNVSYMSAYAVGIGIYKLFIEREFTKKIFSLYYIYSIVTCSALSLYSGGRGGVVLCLVYLIGLFAYYAFVEKKAIKTMKAFFCIFVLLLIGYIMLINNPQFLSGLSRAFEFIDIFKGINWSGTSGRQAIYISCIELIKKHPFFGYGITGSPRNGVVRAHNIILDILIDGGIVYLLFWIIVILVFLKVCINCIYKKREYALIIIFFLSDFIMLMFSGVYMRTSALWFALTFILIKKSMLKYEDLEYEHIDVN